MHSDQRIERFISSILDGSRLPLARRADISEELRSHLAQSVESNRTSGCTDDAAIEAAIHDFGPPHAIRKQLQLQQAHQDRRAVVERFRRCIPIMLILSALFALVIAAAPGIYTPGRSTIAMATIFVAALLGISPVAYVFCLAHLRMKQQLPREEYRLLPNLSRWVAQCFSAIIAFQAILFASVLLTWNFLSVGPIQTGVRASNTDMIRLWIDLAASLLIPSVMFFGMVSFVAGLAITTYQRSKCVSEKLESIPS